MAQKYERAKATRAADAAKIAEIRSRGWGLTSFGPRGARRLMVIGAAAMLVSTAIYARLVIVAIVDRSSFELLNLHTAVYSDEYGSETLSGVQALSGPSVVMFVIGCGLIVMADISRRRPRRVRASVLLGVAIVFAVLWSVVVPLQYITGVLPGDPDFSGARSLLVAPAVVFAAGTLAPVAWLVRRRWHPRA